MEQHPVVLVTGGASGIGRAIVERLARDGFDVVFLDRDHNATALALAELHKQQLRVTAHNVDLTRHDAVSEIVANLPGIYGLVNNAGIFSERKFDEMSADDLRTAYEVNLVALAHLTQQAARRMAAGAKIVNIASRAYLGARNHAHYVASKAAVVGYTRASAMELAAKGILVNAVAPGLIDTPLLRALTPERRAAQIALQPTGKAGRPEDVAHAVAFLMAQQTDFITGQVLFVDGGKSLGGSGA